MTTRIILTLVSFAVLSSHALADAALYVKNLGDTDIHVTVTLIYRFPLELNHEGWHTIEPGERRQVAFTNQSTMTVVLGYAKEDANGNFGSVLYGPVKNMFGITTVSEDHAEVPVQAEPWDFKTKPDDIWVGREDWFVHTTSHRKTLDNEAFTITLRPQLSNPVKQFVQKNRGTRAKPEAKEHTSRKDAVEEYLEKSSRASVRLGDMARDLDEPDYQLAVSFYQMAVDAKSPVGMARLGEMYLKGQGIEQDQEKAMNLFRESAGQKCAEGLHWMGNIYRDGLCGQAEDLAKSIAYYKKSASLSYADSMHSIAALALMQKTDLISREDMVSYLKQASAQNHPDAMYDLANYYLKKMIPGFLRSISSGKQSKSEYERAFDLYQQLARMGDPRGQFEMAIAQFHGWPAIFGDRYVEIDRDAAVAAMTSIADSGYAEAQYTLARWHLKELGGEEGRKRAIHYFTLAASNTGNPWQKSAENQLKRLGIQPNQTSDDE